jgi:hypothetical protein
VIQCHEKFSYLLEFCRGESKANRKIVVNRNRKKRGNRHFCGKLKREREGKKVKQNKNNKINWRKMEKNPE